MDSMVNEDDEVARTSDSDAKVGRPAGIASIHSLVSPRDNPD